MEKDSTQRRIFSAYPIGKRCFDLAASFSLLILFALPMILIAIIILIRQGRPVLFTQKRPGLGGQAFLVLKFRTMNDSLDFSGAILPDAERLTSLGKWLRRSSLDELPQLINVIKGEMSLVGPRPLLIEYLPLYSAEQARRHEVRPGITGWAQVNGRNALKWEDRFKLDVWYVDNYSFFLDMKILFLTIKKVLVKDGINAKDQATMTKFTGAR